MAYAVSKHEFGELVKRALAELPPEFADALEYVRIEVMPRPTPRMLKAARVRHGQTLLGLYRGRPQTIRSVEDSGVLPDVIFLFQCELEAVCESEDDLVEQVRTTVLHELGHYFGLEENDLNGLGYG